MANLTIQKISLSGNKPTFVLASFDGDSFINQGDTYLHIKNGSVMSTTVTVTAQKKCNHGTLHSISLAIPAGEERYIGVFPVDRFNDTNGKVNVTYSSIPQVTVAAIKL